MTGGMDNPVDVVFTPGGERIFTTTFFQHPGGGRRDGLIHAIYGGVYGKDHGVIHEHPWTAPTSAHAGTHGAAAPAGLTRYKSDILGQGIPGQPLRRAVQHAKNQRHVSQADGASFKRTRISSSPQSRLAPDRCDGGRRRQPAGHRYRRLVQAVLPDFATAKPDITGAIYRIRRTGPSGSAISRRLLKIDWAKATAKALGSSTTIGQPCGIAASRHWRRRLAPRCRCWPRFSHSSPSLDARRNAVWTATRIDGEDAHTAVARLSRRGTIRRRCRMHSSASTRIVGR